MQVSTGVVYVLPWSILRSVSTCLSGVISDHEGPDAAPDRPGLEE